MRGERNPNMASQHNGVLEGGTAVDQRPADAQEEEVASADFPIAKEFPLLKLPMEVREMIYEPLIEAGDLSILRVSKIVKQEAVPLLSKVATIRINPESINTSHVAIPITARITLSGILTLAALDYIQNIDLRLNLPIRGPFFRNRELIFCFSGNRVPRKSCKITFNPGRDNVAQRLLGEHVYEIVSLVSSLTGFMMLTLKLEFQTYVDNIGRSLDRHKGIQSSTTHTMLIGRYQNISDLLATRLGPAEFNKSIGDHGLAFRPIDFDENLVKDSSAFRPSR